MKNGTWIRDPKTGEVVEGIWDGKGRAKRVRPMTDTDRAAWKAQAAKAVEWNRQNDEAIAKRRADRDARLRGEAPTPAEPKQAKERTEKK